MKVSVKREIGITLHLTVAEAETLRIALNTGKPVNELDKYLAGYLSDALHTAATIVNNLPLEDITDD